MMETGGTGKVRTESEMETRALFKALKDRQFDQAKQIINKGTHININYTIKKKGRYVGRTLEGLCIDCGHVSLARLVLERTGAKNRIPIHNTPKGNSLLNNAISKGSRRMISLCLEFGAKLGIHQFEFATRASSPIQTFLSKYASEIFNSTDWEHFSPSDKLVYYFLSLKLFAPQWIKNINKYSNETMDLLVQVIPSSLVQESTLDRVLSYLVKRDDVDLLHTHVQKWGVQLPQLQKSPAVYATSLPMMSYLKKQGCFDARLPNNQNPLHQLFNNRSLLIEKTYGHMIQLGVDPFSQDDQGNTPLHVIAIKRSWNSEIVKKITNNFTDVKFYTVLNSSQKSVSTLYKPLDQDRESFLLLYRFYEKVMNSQSYQQEPWFSAFQVNILGFCKKLFSSYTANTMEALTAYAATINYEMMKPILMEKKSSLLNQNIGRGYTLLMHCAEHKSLSVCQELIQWGADPFIVTDDHTTVFKSISTDNLHYFLSLGMDPTFEDIKSMKPKIQVELLDHSNTYQTIVQAVVFDGSLLFPLLSEIVTRGTSFKPFAICKIEEWLKQLTPSQQVELFSSNCKHGNAQITQSFLKIVPIDVLSSTKITGVADEKIVTTLLQEGIPFDCNNIQKQAIIPLLRFRPHYILRFGRDLKEDILPCFLSFFKQGNYSHLPYNFMEKKVLFHRDIIIVTHGYTKELKRKRDAISCSDDDEYEANMEYVDPDCRRSCYSRLAPHTARESEREHFERTPPMSSLVAQLQAMIRDLRERNAKRLSKQELIEHRRQFIEFDSNNYDDDNGDDDDNDDGDDDDDDDDRYSDGSHVDYQSDSSGYSS